MWFSQDLVGDETTHHPFRIRLLLNTDFVIYKNDWMLCWCYNSVTAIGSFGIILFSTIKS